jgi:hypothetical protein
LGTAATNTIDSAPEQCVQIVPPTDVVTVLCGAVVGGGDVIGGDSLLGGLEPDGTVGGPPGLGGGETALVGLVPPELFVVVDGRPAVGGEVGPVGARVVGTDGDAKVDPSALAIPRSESRATPGGATLLATLATAANASATLAATPANHRQVSTSPRLISRLSLTITASHLKASTRAAQVLPAVDVGLPASPYPRGAWPRC